MKLDPDKFKVDESRSNPMVVAMQYPDCPIDAICFFMVTGFGSIVEKCKHFKESGEEGKCLYKEVILMTGGEIGIILALIEAAAKYGIPLVQSAIAALDKDTITAEDIQNLKITMEPEEF